MATTPLRRRIVEYFAHGKGLKLTLVSGQIGFVLADVIAKLKTVLASAAKVMREALRPRPCSIVSSLATDLLRSRAELAVENVLLRQQLIVAGRTAPPTLRVSPDLVGLIRRMASENRLWGAEPIRGELLKLGIRVAKRTVQRYMRDRRNPAPPRGQSWHTFLHNHAVWACNFLQTYDVWFRQVFAFFIVDINSKQVVHVGVTRHPTAQWTAQQLREATPFGAAPQCIIRDNDGKFGGWAWQPGQAWPSAAKVVSAESPAAGRQRLY